MDTLRCSSCSLLLGAAVGANALTTVIHRGEGGCSVNSTLPLPVIQSLIPKGNSVISRESASLAIKAIIVTFPG